MSLIYLPAELLEKKELTMEEIDDGYPLDFNFLEGFLDIFPVPNNWSSIVSLYCNARDAKVVGECHGGKQVLRLWGFAPEKSIIVNTRPKAWKVTIFQ